MQFGAEGGLIGILCMYSNELITELKATIADHDKDDDDESDLMELLGECDNL